MVFEHFATVLTSGLSVGVFPFPASLPGLFASGCVAAHLVAFVFYRWPDFAFALPALVDPRVIICIVFRLWLRYYLISILPLLCAPTWCTSPLQLCYSRIYLFLWPSSFAFRHIWHLGCVCRRHLLLLASNRCSRAREFSEHLDKVADLHETSRGQKLLCGALLHRHPGAVDELQHCRKHLRRHTVQPVGRLTDLILCREHDGEVLAACCQQGFVRLEVHVFHNESDVAQ